MDRLDLDHITDCISRVTLKEKDKLNPREYGINYTETDLSKFVSAELHCALRIPK